MDKSRFESQVEKTLKFVVETLAEDDLYYPSLTVIGMAAVLIREPELLRVEATEDVDILAGFREDIADLARTWEELEERGLADGQVLAHSHVVSFFPFGDEPPMSFDFVYPSEDLEELFTYTRRNTGKEFAEFEDTKFYVARLEDAILCKAVVGRKKDVRGLSRAIPALEEKGSLNWNYFWKTARKNSVRGRVKETLQRADIKTKHKIPNSDE